MWCMVPTVEVRCLGKNTLGTSGSLRGGKLTHLISKNPEDISSWKVLENISPFGTYPQFVQMDDGTIYLFYRHGSHRRDWAVLKHKAQPADPTVHDAWYAWFGKGMGDTIVAQYVYHPCATNPNHTNERTNVYFMNMNAKDGAWTNIRGERLTVSVTKEYADQKTRVLNSGAHRCNHGVCRVDSKGNPHLLFQVSGKVRYSPLDGQ